MGLPSASTSALILVLRPPRERPIASSWLPFAPAACWWARTILRSSGIRNRDFFHQRVEDAYPQTPFLAQHWKTLVQWPNAGGRMRRGAPARAILSTAPRRQIDDCPRHAGPGTRCWMRSHVNSRRIKIALPSCDLESHSRVSGIPYMSTGRRDINDFFCLIGYMPFERLAAALQLMQLFLHRLLETDDEYAMQYARTGVHHESLTRSLHLVIRCKNLSSPCPNSIYTIGTIATRLISR